MFNRQEIEKLIKEKGIVSNHIDLETQLTPNGFDLTVEKVFDFTACGEVDFSNKERVIPEGREISAEKKSPQDKFGWWNLKKGAYKVRFNEVFNLPRDMLALAFVRTSLLRMGAVVHNGVWDAGFQGKGEALLVVENPCGIKIKQNSRLVHILFTSINETEQGYNGIHKNKT